MDYFNFSILFDTDLFVLRLFPINFTRCDTVLVTATEFYSFIPVLVNLIKPQVKLVAKR